MWIFVIREPHREPQEYQLKAGRNTLGRKSGSDLLLSDVSASRLHAIALCDPVQNRLTLTDAGSTNGTFVNRERIFSPHDLKHDDQIRIGGITITVVYQDTHHKAPVVAGARRFTRELVLEALDHHAVLLYEVAERLNTVLDLESALAEVSELMRSAMGADRCQVISADRFDELGTLGFPTALAQATIEQQAAIIVPEMASSPYRQGSDSAILYQVQTALCVPVISNSALLALIYLHKSQQGARPFGEHDLKLAVAISHQAALTIERMHLLEQVRREQRGRQLLERFISPQEIEYMLADYMEHGHLPPLQECQVTVLFADMADSTGLSNRVGAFAFSELLNRYYWDLSDTIFEFGGLVRYSGDGIMAIFGLLGNPDGHELRAVQAALAILDHITHVDYGVSEPVVLGVGVNTGLAMVGYVGTQQRIELTALGYAINVAHALQQAARPNRLLIGAETALRMTSKLPLKDLGALQIKGSNQMVQVYEVLRPAEVSQELP